MSENIVAEVKKAGEIPIQIGLRRHQAGLRIQVKVLPIIENFFRDLSNGEIQPVINHGRYWLPNSPRSLQVYAITSRMPTMQAEDDTRFSILTVGQPLITPAADRPGCEILNLSFLRLVGASDGDGVGFSVKGVMDLEETRKTAQKFMLASRRFYLSYIRPVSINVFVSTQEMR